MPAGVSTGTLTMVHPLENQKLPAVPQIFAFGQAPVGSTLTINGAAVSLHAKGGYLTMVPLVPGENVLRAEALTSSGAIALERKLTVGTPFAVMASTPLAINRTSLQPSGDLWLTAGDVVKVSFQGASGARAEFGIEGFGKHFPMQESISSSGVARGVYSGQYQIQPGDKADAATIEFTLKKQGWKDVHEQAPGKLRVKPSPIVRVGQVLDDTVAARTGPDGGYDFFLYKGMRVRLSGRMNGHWRVQPSASQAGWVRESAIQEMAAGFSPPSSVLTNYSLARQADSTVIRIPLSDMLPFRVEQSASPMQLTVTLFGAVVKTDQIKHDPTDTLIRQLAWRQSAADTAQLIIAPRFSRWWGYSVRYEGSTLLIEIREPWTSPDLRGLPIAIDAGHGGSDSGAIGPLGTREKDVNLRMAEAIREALTRAGARVFMTRTTDTEVPLYERGRLAWRAGARLFISVHSNAAGVWENPIWSNGFSVYFYQPQSKELAAAVHSEYRRQLTGLPDIGLFYADLAVCRITEMPSILTEQAYIIVPEQEQMLLDPAFHRQLGVAVVNGVKAWLAQKP